jgi:hypothetical protein
MSHWPPNLVWTISVQHSQRLKIGSYIHVSDRFGLTVAAKKIAVVNIKNRVIGSQNRRGLKDIFMVLLPGLRA